MNIQRIELLVWSHPDLERQLPYRADGAPMARGDFDPYAQAAGIGSVAYETKLQLLVGVAAFVAQKLQPPFPQDEQEIRVTVVIKIGGSQLVNLCPHQFI
jgi:hypothetical protein